MFYIGESCYTPNNYYGICVVLSQCPSLVNYYGLSPNHPTVINFLVMSQRNCGTRSIQRNPLVCCLDPVYYRPQPTYQPTDQTTEQPVYQSTTEQITQTVPQTTSQPVQTTQSTPETKIQPTTAKPTLNEKSCQDPNGVNGVCKSLKECPSILKEFLARNTDNAYIQYIKQSNVNCRKIQPFICCPQDETTSIAPPVETIEATTKAPTSNAQINGRLLLPSEGCGFTKVKNTKIVGGQTAKIGQLERNSHFYFTRNYYLLYSESKLKKYLLSFHRRISVDFTCRISQQLWRTVF